MNDQSLFVASLLRQGGHALAAYAANELLETRPEAKTGLGPDPFTAWQVWLCARLDELAAAVSVGEPALFVGQVQWARAILAARGLPVEHARASLERLRGVLAEALPDEGRAEVTGYLDGAIEAFDLEPEELSDRLLPDTTHRRLASEYLLAVFEGDRRRASRLILDAADGGDSIPDLFLHVLLPAQAELGRMWVLGEINVVEEHFASATTKSVMAQLMARATIRPGNGKTLLAAAVAGNYHDIGIEAVADFFEMDGWRTVYLGADVPVADLAQAVDFFQVDLLGLSVSLTTQLDTVRTTISAVRAAERGGRVKILVGGTVFHGENGRPAALGADGFAPDPSAAVELGRHLVGLDREGNG